MLLQIVDWRDVRNHALFVVYLVMMHESALRFGTSRLILFCCV